MIIHPSEKDELNSDFFLRSCQGALSLEAQFAHSSLQEVFEPFLPGTRRGVDGGGTARCAASRRGCSCGV